MAIPVTNLPIKTIIKFIENDINSQPITQTRLEKHKK